MSDTHAEPSGRYVVHWHSARRVHFDLRVELDGVAKSWAVPKGPPLVSGLRRLAIATPDHPLEFLDFEGDIAPGEYGAGPIRIWDRGRFTVEKRTDAELKLNLLGEKLSGSYVLVATGDSNWLFFKHAGADGSGTPQADSQVPEGPRRLPAFSPMLCAAQAHEPFDDERFFFEIKWDGVRALSFIADGEVDCRSRTGQDLRHSFPELSRVVRNVCAVDAVIDGEIVVLDDQGVSDFQRLQQRLGTPATPDAEPVVYYVFDLLYADGVDLTALSLSERRARLSGLLEPDGRVRHSEAVGGSGVALFERAIERGAEGLIAKRGDSRYLPGQRSDAWLKLTRTQHESFLIGGYTRGKGARGSTLGALLLGEGTEEPLNYVGRVGSGLTDAELADAAGRLRGLERETSPFDPVPKLERPVTWVEPRLRCEIDFARRTRAGKLRAPRFRRLVGEPATVSVSNPDKLFWPEAGVTKADMVGYYADVASVIGPHLADRPMVMNRFPDGWRGQSFYQKNAPEHRPEWLETVALYSESSHRTIDYPLCNDKAHLIWLANAGCIEMNPWLSRLPALDSPTQILFDLDPNPPADFAAAAEVSLALRAILDRLGLKSFPKTSGGRGVHVMVPVQAGLSFSFVRMFAEAVARVLVTEHPKLVTIEHAKADRGARVLVDYRQNRKGSTIASVYSVRPRAGAPVSTPLDWRELEDLTDPAAFSFDTVRERISTRGDLFYGVLTERQPVASAVDTLAELSG